MNRFATKICFLIFLQLGVVQLGNGKDISGSEKLKSALVNFLNEKFADRKVEYIVDLKTKIDENFVQNCDEINVIQKSGSGYKGYQTFKVKVCSNGDCKEMLVQAFIRTFENVLLARRDLKRGEVMESSEKIFDSFLIEKIETTFLKDDFVSEARVILGKKVRKLIKKGEIIFESYFEELPLVKAGEKVKVIARTGNVKVETFGIAKADGKLNDFIRILNPTSGKLFDAKVVNRGVVEVEIEN